MADESTSPRPGASGYLADLLADLRKKSISALSLAILAGLGVIGSGLLATLSFGWVSLSERTVWILCGVVGTVVLHAVVLLLVRAYVRSRSRQTVLVIEDDESHAIERFREAYEPCMKPVRLAYEILERDVCRSAQANEHFNDLLARLIEDWVLPPSKAAIDALEVAMKDRGAVSRADRDTLFHEFKSVLYGTYPKLVGVILLIGGHIRGMELFNLPRHLELQRSHVAMIEELRRARPRTDIGEIAALMRNVENLNLVPLARPSTDPLPPTASGPTPPP
jgi:hypothetical protein